MKITIHGNTISKKNSKQIVPTATGKHRVISSANYQQWAKDAMYQLGMYDKPRWNYPVKVRMTFYRENKRRADYNNLGQGPLDCLVAAGILADDDMSHVIPEYTPWQVDKAAPRVEIEIIDGGRDE